MGPVDSLGSSSEVEGGCGKRSLAVELTLTVMRLGRLLYILSLFHANYRAKPSSKNQLESSGGLLLQTERETNSRFWVHSRGPGMSWAMVAERKLKDGVVSTNGA
jgi:hypothetical protein